MPQFKLLKELCGDTGVRYVHNEHKIRVVRIPIKIPRHYQVRIFEEHEAYRQVYLFYHLDLTEPQIKEISVQVYRNSPRIVVARLYFKNEGGSAFWNDVYAEAGDGCFEHDSPMNENDPGF